MKNFSIYIMTSFLLAILFYACKEDELSDESIFKNNISEQTDFDLWLLSNYVYPYNIMFKYKMEDIESNKNFNLVPATTDKCVAMAKLLKYLWMESYDEIQGINFTRAYTPKIIVLVGSGAYDSNNNTITLGTADAGMRITLYDINSLNPDNPDIIRLQDYMKTIYHEFSHILHQKKDYPIEFGEISHDDYIQDSWSASSETLEIANQKGFVSRYARHSTDEDFVELIAHFVILGQENWDNILAAAGTDGASKINRKFEIVKQYLIDSWGLDIYELRRVFENRLASVDSLDLKNL